MICRLHCRACFYFVRDEDREQLWNDGMERRNGWHDIDDGATCRRGASCLASIDCRLPSVPVSLAPIAASRGLFCYPFLGFAPLKELFCRSDLKIHSFVSHDTSCVNECHQLVSSLPTTTHSICTVTCYPWYWQGICIERVGCDPWQQRPW